MENFRNFEAGPDPFGRTWHVLFKFLQTAISIRHSDSVDVRFILTSGEETLQKTIVLQNADLRAWEMASSDRKLSDTWCSRVAMCKLRRSIETAEDLDKDYMMVTRQELDEFGAEIKTWEAEWVKKHAA
jgi:hypothetical protein